MLYDTRITYIDLVATLRDTDNRQQNMEYLDEAC